MPSEKSEEVCRGEDIAKDRSSGTVFEKVIRRGIQSAHKDAECRGRDSLGPQKKIPCRQNSRPGISALKNLIHPEDRGNQSEEGDCKGTRSLVFYAEEVFFRA